MRFLAIATLAVALLAGTVSAQRWSEGGYYRASTVGESRARGVADMVRAAGETNLRNSEAMINIEDARSRNLDNRLKYAETYFAKRRVNQEYRDENRRATPSEDQLFRMSQSARPKRLTPSELDPLTGKVRWPSLLRDDRFAKQRDALDGLFEKLAKHDHVNYDELSQIRAAGDSMSEKLSGIIREVPSKDYIAADRFLKSLMYEARVRMSG